MSTKYAKKNDQKSSKEPRLGGWLWSTKGTIAEPWATPEELLKDKKVQQILQRARQNVSRKNGGEKK